MPYSPSYLNPNSAFFMAYPCLPNDQIINRRFNKENNLIIVQFGLGRDKNVNKLCTFLHFGFKKPRGNGQ